MAKVCIHFYIECLLDIFIKLLKTTNTYQEQLRVQITIPKDGIKRLNQQTKYVNFEQGSEIRSPGEVTTSCLACNICPPNNKIYVTYIILHQC